MAFYRVALYLFLLLFHYISSSHAFMENFNGRRHELVNNEARPDLPEIVDQQINTNLNIELHVGDEEHGFLTVQDMIIQLGGRFEDDDEERVSLPGNDARHSKYTAGARRMNVVSKGTFIDSKGTQHVECEKRSWEMCWVKGRPAGTIVFAFNLAQTYKRNQAILPGGNMWLSFPVWTLEGLKSGQMAKREVLDEIDFYTQKWNKELDKFEMTSNPILRAIYEHNAHKYATRCDDLYDYSLDTIPDDDQYSKIQEDLLLSKKGLIWKKDGNDDILLGHAVAFPLCNDELLPFLNYRLRP